jgi:hypothetical protein
MFGRMTTSMRFEDVEAAMQVAHAYQPTRRFLMWTTSQL